jgi:hypothetical protein
VLCGVSKGLSLVKALEGSKEVDCWAVRMLGYDGGLEWCGEERRYVRWVDTVDQNEHG